MVRWHRASGAAGVLGLILAGCTDAADARPTAPPVDWLSAADAQPSAAAAVKRRDAAGKYLAALASEPLSNIARELDPDAGCSFPGMLSARGRQQVADMHELLFSAFASRKFVASRILRTREVEALEWSMTGLQERDWIQVPATHGAVAFRGLTLLWTKDDGTVTDVAIYFDVAAIKAELGRQPTAAEVLPAASAPQELEQQGSATEMENVATERKALDALEYGDEAAYLSCMTDDTTLFTLERAAPATGKAAERAYYQSMRRAIGDLDTTIVNVWGVERFVVVEYLISGEQRAALGGVPPVRDRVVQLHLVDVVELREGRIARVWRYDNPLEISTGGPTSCAPRTIEQPAAGACPRVAWGRPTAKWSWGPPGLW